MPLHISPRRVSLIMSHYCSLKGLLKPAPLLDAPPQRARTITTCSCYYGEITLINVQHSCWHALLWYPAPRETSRVFWPIRVRLLTPAWQTNRLFWSNGLRYESRLGDRWLEWWMDCVKKLLRTSQASSPWDSLTHRWKAHWSLQTNRSCSGLLRTLRFVLLLYGTALLLFPLAFLFFLDPQVGSGQACGDLGVSHHRLRHANIHAHSASKYLKFSTV